MPQESILAQYANVFIPLAISFLGAVASYAIFKEKVRRLESDMKEVKNDAKEVRDKVIICETTLKEREPLTKKKSPISLSDRGTIFLEKSGGKKFVEDNFSELLQKVEARNPKTAYDVQEVAKEVIASFAEDERINQLKDFIFKDGSPLDDLIIVMGVYLRDKVLVHKKWNVEDIDKYDKRAS